MTRLLDLWKTDKNRRLLGDDVEPSGGVDYDHLEEYLRALGHARRLELLHMLQVPHSLPNIRLTPGRLRAGDAPDRPVSRQAIQRHLDTLQEVGLVVAHLAASGRAKEYVVDRQRVYQILEELRRVGMLTAASFVSSEVTVETGGARPRQVAPGPKLVLVHGFVEGKVYQLDSTQLTDGGGWVIGRKPGLSVSVDYDPFVSLVNSEIRLEGGEYTVTDLGSSKNGTWVNWQPVYAEGVPIKAGDVLGVGRSLLVFQPE